MINIIFWSLFLCLITIVSLQLKLAGEKFNKISIVNVTTASLIAFSVIGTVPLFYFLDEYRFNVGINDQWQVLTVLFYSVVNIVFFLNGVIFVRRIVGLKNVPYNSNEVVELSFIQKVFIFILFLFCCIALILYLRQLDSVAIIVAFTDSISSSKAARSDMGNSFSGKYHWYNLFIQHLGNLVTFSLFAEWLNRKGYKSFVLLLLSFLFSTFVAVVATEKAPLAWLLIGLFMTYFLIKRNGIVPIRKLFSFIIIILFLLSISYVFFMGTESLSAALWSVFSRAFAGSISPAYFYLDYYPQYQDFLLGQTFPNPGGFLPHEPVRYTVEIAKWKFPTIANLGIVGSMPTVFWGESYVNFGAIGIPIVAFGVGIFVSVFSFLVSKLEVNPLTVGYLVSLILLFKDLSITGFSGYLFNIYIIILSFSVVFLTLTKGSIKLRRCRNKKNYKPFTS